MGRPDYYLKVFFLQFANTSVHQSPLILAVSATMEDAEIDALPLVSFSPSSILATPSPKNLPFSFLFCLPLFKGTKERREERRGEEGRN